MSRLAKSPVEIPTGVEVNLTDTKIAVKGRLGLLDMNIHDSVKIDLNKNKDEQTNLLTFAALEATKFSRAMSGTTRALVNNMVLGVSVGFKKHLKLVGVGYRAQLKGKKILLSLGFSHQIEYEIPEGITLELPNNTEILVIGINKQLVGQVAAEIRNFRPPERYKGKGVQYVS